MAKRTKPSKFNAFMRNEREGDRQRKQDKKRAKKQERRERKRRGNA